MENSTPKTKIQDNYRNNDDTDAGKLKKLIENVGIEKFSEAPPLDVYCLKVAIVYLYIERIDWVFDVSLVFLILFFLASFCSYIRSCNI